MYLVVVFAVNKIPRNVAASEVVQRKGSHCPVRRCKGCTLLKVQTYFCRFHTSETMRLRSVQPVKIRHLVIALQQSDASSFELVVSKRSVLQLTRSR